jgi:hypothetical protein
MYVSQGLLLLDDLDALTEHVHVQSSHSWSNQRMSVLKRYVCCMSSRAQNNDQHASIRHRITHAERMSPSAPRPPPSIVAESNPNRSIWC